MRWIAPFLGLLLASLASAQSEDARLQKKVTFDVPFLSLADLGKEVTRVSGVAVSVDRAIADRKVALFCDDRPIGEIMERIAGTIFLEWAKEGDGFRLKLDAEAVKGEREIASMEDRLGRAAALADIQAAIDVSRPSLADAQKIFRTLNEQYEASWQDRTPEGRERSAALSARLRQRYPYNEVFERWNRGRVLAQLSSTQVDALLNGQTFIASTTSGPGLLRLEPEAMQIFKAQGSEMPVPPAMMLIIRPNSSGSGINFAYRTLSGTNGNSGTTYSVSPLDSRTVMDALLQQRLVKRLLDWAKVRDETVMKAPVNREAVLPKEYPAKIWSLSENLQWLHRRSGVPIVADAFRLGFNFDLPSVSKDVETFLAKLDPPTNGTWTALPPYVHSEGGWLMLRHKRFWRKLPAEAPERLIQPLEAKAAERPLTLEDYAGFVGALTPRQVGANSASQFLVRFPIHALSIPSVYALRLWAALPAAGRQSALKNGFPLLHLSTEGRERATTLIFELVFGGLAEEAILASFVPGGEGIPRETMVFARNESTQPGSISANPNPVEPRPMSSFSYSYKAFTGFYFLIGTSTETKLRVSVPLYPKEPFTGS